MSQPAATEAVPKKKSHRLRNTVIILVVLVFIIAIVASSNQGNVSNAQSVKVTQVAEDDSAPAGTTFYLLTIDASYSGTGSWDFNPLFLQLVSINSSVYSLTFSLSFKNLISAVTLSNGQHTSGQVVFQLPSDQKPAKLDYNDNINNIKVEVATIPAVSSWVSQFLVVDVNSTTPNGITVDTLATVQNDSIYYYTGERVAIQVAIFYVPFVGEPSQITLASITNSNGLSMSSTQPMLPTTVSGGTQETDVTVFMVAPSQSFSGDVHLNLQFST